MSVRHVDSTNPGQSNLVFGSKPIPEAEMSNRLIFVGRGGTLVESMPLNRKVVGSNPILAATPRTLGKSFTLPVALRRVNSDTMSIAVVGSAHE